MYRIFSVLIILGLFVWGFLLYQRHGSDTLVPEYAGWVDDAEETERCAQYRTEVADDGDLDAEADGDAWSLGYGGRIRQLIHGCL